MALLTGVLVAVTAALVRQLLNHEPSAINGYVADGVAGMVSAFVSMGIHLSYESQHYKYALERAAVFSEVNHHVRNAIFPLCLAVQKTDDQNAAKICDDAVNRINSALREAVTDTFARKLMPVEVAKKKASAA
jgi:hypothetical protein